MKDEGLVVPWPLAAAKGGVQRRFGQRRFGQWSQARRRYGCGGVWALWLLAGLGCAVRSPVHGPSALANSRDAGMVLGDPEPLLPPPGLEPPSVAVAEAELPASRPGVEETPPGAPVVEELAEPAGLAACIRLALTNNAEIRAAFEARRARRLQIAQVDRLPEPVVSFAYFVRSVETRVGPQLARLSVRQDFPWPGELSARAASVSEEALALDRQLAARTLAIVQRISDHYWHLWLIRKARALHQEHQTLLQALQESVLARVIVGGSTLAEPQQVALARAKVQELLSGMEEEERETTAALAAELGTPETDHFSTPDEPASAGLPVKTRKELHRLAAAHPLVHVSEHQARAHLHRADAEESRAYPSFSAFADWTIVGRSKAMPEPVDSGKDAVMIGGGVRIPLWQGSYSDGAEALRAAALSETAQARHFRNQAYARVEQVLARLSDARRRVRLYRDTLVPQAELTLSSVLGGFTAGRVTVREPLSLQQELLELRIALETARADHARSWAQLEEVTATRIEAQLDQPDASPSLLVEPPERQE